MKTPGRKRTVGGNATNQSTGAHQHSLASARKDPLATLLFPVASPRGSAITDKENSGPTTPASTRTSPRKLLSPLATSASNAGPPAPSPLRLSPRPASVAVKSSPNPKKRSPRAVAHTSIEPTSASALEATQAADAAKQALLKEPLAPHREEETTEEVKADLSIIGEEEEEEATADGEPAAALSPAPSQAASSLVIVEETQASQIDIAAASVSAKVLSPARNVSNASSVAPEADADAEDDHTVPLNDAPSTLRSVDLSSSLSASTTRTPGSSTSRFTLGTYSAGKLGNLGLGSSPPTAGTAPSASSGRLANPRISSGGPAPRQLNFVGLPKKSLGHGLGLGRGWTNQGASATDSQGSTTATVGSSQGTASQPSTSAPAIEPDSVQVASSVTASGATKRKSLTGPDSANKAPKLAEPALTEQELKRKRYEELNNRMQSLQARQSVLGGRASNVAGPFGASSIFGGGPKPFGASSTSLFQQASVPPVAKPVLANAPAASAPAADVSAVPSRRPSVMERVRSFESNTTGNEAMHPPSPSKIPAALTGGAQHSARPTSPPLSPRRLVSPGPASPRLLSRTTSSNLPLAASASPRSQAAVASPRPATISRSPTIQPISASISSMLSGADANAEASRTQQKIALVQPKSPARSPVRTVETAPKPVYRSTSPVGSPPQLDLHHMLRQTTVQQQDSSADRIAAIVEEADEQDDEEDDEEPVQSIRAINASVPPEVVAQAAAAEKARKEAEEAKARSDREAASRREAEAAARVLEEQEAQREREELLRKRLPSLPEARPASDDESFNSDEEAESRAAQKTDSSRVRHDDKAKVASTSAPQSDAGAEDGEDADEPLLGEDFTSMSMLSTATTTATFNLSQHQPFKPVVAHKAPLQQQKAHAKSSIASTVSTASASTLSRSVSNNALGSSLSKKPKIEVNAVKRAAAAAAAKKVSVVRAPTLDRPILTARGRMLEQDKEERERQAAIREEKRAALLRKKQEEERRVKAEGLEKKRKEREEAVTKAAKSAALRGVKAKVSEVAGRESRPRIADRLSIRADGRGTGKETQD